MITINSFTGQDFSLRISPASDQFSGISTNQQLSNSLKIPGLPDKQRLWHACRPKTSSHSSCSLAIKVRTGD